MKRRFINFFIAAAVLMLLSVVSYLRNGLENDATGRDCAGHPPMETVRQFLPDAATIDFFSEEDIFRVLDQADDLTGFVVLSSPYMDAITGYSGPTPVMIALDADGRIAGVELMQNSETPGFIRQLHEAGFFAKWDGLAVEDAAAGEVDAVSGATMSSEAIAATVRGRLAMLGDGIDEERFAAYDRKVFSFQDGVILFVLLGSVLIHLQSASLVARGWLPHVRYAWRVVSVLLLGMYSATMVSMALLDGWVNSGRIHGGAGIVVMVFLAIGWALFTGKNLYCHYICPFGALQELFFRVSPFRRRLPTALTKRLRYVRYILMFLTVVYIFLRVGLPPEMQEPFSAFRPRAAGIPAISFAVLAVFVAIAGVNRPWCTYFCSAGAMLDLLRKTGKKKRKKSDEESMVIVSVASHGTTKRPYTTHFWTGDLRDEVEIAYKLAAAEKGAGMVGSGLTNLLSLAEKRRAVGQQPAGPSRRGRDAARDGSTRNCGLKLSSIRFLPVLNGGRGLPPSSRSSSIAFSFMSLCLSSACMMISGNKQPAGRKHHVTSRSPCPQVHLCMAIGHAWRREP